MWSVGFLCVGLFDQCLDRLEVPIRQIFEAPFAVGHCLLHRREWLDRGQEVLICGRGLGLNVLTGMHDVCAPVVCLTVITLGVTIITCGQDV